MEGRVQAGDSQSTLPWGSERPSVGRISSGRGKIRSPGWQGWEKLAKMFLPKGPLQEMALKFLPPESDKRGNTDKLASYTKYPLLFFSVASCAQAFLLTLCSGSLLMGLRGLCCAWNLAGVWPV